MHRMLDDTTRWLFAPQDAPSSVWRTLAWWEARRVPFNLIVGSYGVLCLVVFVWGLSTSGRLRPGEDAIEPMALLAAPFLVNALYCLGWLVEIPLHLIAPNASQGIGPILLKLGFAVGLGLISVPAAYWGGFRLLQLVKLAR
jgi:hypothetical protein